MFHPPEDFGDHDRWRQQQPERHQEDQGHPCWCFHNDKYTTARVLKSQDMIKALRDARGKPRYTEYLGIGYNSWDKTKTYAEKEL